MNDSICLVTGAAGFLGGTVCRQLIAQGRRVRALVLPGDRAMRFVPPEAEVCEGDLTDMPSLERFFDVPEGTAVDVIHCASIVTVNPDYNPKVMEVNVGGTQNIIECYILGNREVNFRDFAKLVADEAGCRPIRFFLPCKAADFVAGILEKRAKKRGERPLMTTFSVYNLARNNDFDSGKAMRELGYTTRSYQETMRDEVAWLKRAGKIGAVRV